MATRDIEPGEEVFIDYGKEWEAAWKKYVKEWKPPSDSDSFVSALTFQKDFNVPLRTIYEEEKDKQYPDNIVFYCRTSSLFLPHEVDGVLKPWGEGNWEYNWENFLVGVPMYPCKIISRSPEPWKDDDGNLMGHGYSAILLTEDELVDVRDEVWVQELIPSGEVHTIHNIPRIAVEVRDKMYTKNEFLDGSFRHPMMIPDDIFPEAWMKDYHTIVRFLSVCAPRKPGCG